ncbi:MAG TPA: HEPN domain-containing protein [Bacilli bacterium]
MRYSDSARVMLGKASGSYLSASNDIRNGIFDRAVSSLYYSAFQTVTALMLLRELRSKSHTDVRAYVNRDLVRPGHLSIELGKMYNRLMDMRSDADYSDSVTFSKHEVESLAERVKEFNSAVKSIINSDGLETDSFV